MKIDDTNVVVDPTQGQFEGGSEQIAVEAEWIKRMEGVKVKVATGFKTYSPKTYAMKYKDGESFKDVNDNYANNRKISFDDAGGTVIITSVEAKPASNDDAPYEGMRALPRETEKTRCCSGCTLM